MQSDSIRAKLRLCGNDSGFLMLIYSVFSVNFSAYNLHFNLGRRNVVYYLKVFWSDFNRKEPLGAIVSQLSLVFNWNCDGFS